MEMEEKKMQVRQERQAIQVRQERQLRQVRQVRQARRVRYRFLCLDSQLFFRDQFSQAFGLASLVNEIICWG
jgi:hypothetical protein